ncbi:MAG: DNA sulfur modification protein DndD [Pelagibacterales bacterium]|nr:DNA sulfur modification protein DndD [Pelagibacterales bacterium]|tara:strand:+ start:1597 stop:3651 length:2055 start_codon:yes stop_codon:yes gene_type:complete
MFIKKILLSNYKIYYQQNTVDFTKDSNKNISIISGYNGFGKTTFLTSLVWCIYGKHMQDIQPYFKEKILQKGGYKKYLETSLNHKANFNGIDSFFVELTLTDVSIPGLGCDEVVLRRTYKLGSSNDKLEIFIDNNENELVKEIGNEIFIQDFLLPKEIAKFFFFDAERITSIAEISTIEDKRNLSKAYTEVLGIKKYEELRENLIRTKLKYTKQSASKSDSNAISDFEASIKLLKDEIVELQLSISSNNEKIELFGQEAEKLQTQLIREGSELTVSEINELRNRKDVLNEERKDILTSYKGLLNLFPFALNIELLKEIMLQSKKEGSSDDSSKLLVVNALNDLERKILSEISDFKIKDKVKKIISKKIMENEESNIDLIHGLSTEESSSLGAIINNIETNYKSRVKEISRLLKINNSERNKSIRALSSAETKNKDKLIENIRSKKEICLSSIDKLQKENLYNSEKIGSLSNVYNAKQGSLKELSKKVKTAKSLLKKDELTARLISQLDEFILKIKNTKKIALQKRILNSLNLLMHKKSFIKNVKVIISEDIIDIELYNIRGKRINKEDFSEGEKQLYATSLLKALVEESNIKFPVFVDSPLQKFDEQHTENIITKFYPSISDQVVVFPLLNKELSEIEYSKIKNKISNTIIINNKDEESSELVKVNIDELFSMNMKLNKKEKYV